MLNYEDFKFSYASLTWESNYKFKEYYGLPLDQTIDANLMKQLQQKMESDSSYKMKYATKASSNPASAKYYCNTYDTKEKMNECNGIAGSFKGKV